MIVYFFGVVFLFSCFNYVLRKIVSENEVEVGMVVVEIMCCNFYVDDCLKLVFIKVEVKDLISSLC